MNRELKQIILENRKSEPDKLLLLALNLAKIEDKTDRQVAIYETICQASRYSNNK